MTGTTATGHLDVDGEEFVDGAQYTDRYGDTWKAVFDATEFLHVKRVDEEQADWTCNRWCEDAVAVARDFGPMTKVTEATR